MSLARHARMLDNTAPVYFSGPRVPQITATVSLGNERLMSILLKDGPLTDIERAYVARCEAVAGLKERDA